MENKFSIAGYHKIEATKYGLKWIIFISKFNRNNSNQKSIE